MDLIDDVDPLADIGRGVDGFVPQRTDLIHTIVGSGVQLQHVQKAAAFDSHAGRTLTAGVSIYRMLTVDSLGQDFGTGGFSRAAGTGKKIGMGRTSFCYLLFQRVGNMGLSDDVGKRFRPPFTVQRLVHGFFPSRNMRVLRMQLRNRHPRGTWDIPLNAARFPA